jgi:putative ABC transport system substrate-binding protein
VVFLLFEDPIAAGLVESYARPGGNVTGVGYPFDPSLAAKRLELLAQAVPSIRRVGVLVGDAGGPTWRELEETARARDVELLPLVVRSRDELAGVLADGAAAGAQALLMTATLPYYTSGDFFEFFTAINRFAQQQRLPLVPDGDAPAHLLSYSPSYQALWATGAVQVDRVLRGAKPAQTPVELVKEYELAVNLALAQTLGLTIAPAVLARATLVTFPGAVTPTRVR